MNKSITQTITFLLASHILTSSLTADQPNILIIMADDCTHNDLPLYGGQNANTPNLDQFAREGMTFNRAYLGEAMCQPCRAELYSGQYPMRNGCAWNHSASRPSTKSMPHYLRPLGYRVGLAGKVHVAPEEAFPFEMVGGFESNCVRNPTRPHDVQPIREFMLARPFEPFCLVVALVEPHVPWVMGDASEYPPARDQAASSYLPTHPARGKISRATWPRSPTWTARSVRSSRSCSSREPPTILWSCSSSEQGAQFPGCKWTNWDTGLHSALISRWPGKIAQGSANRRAGAVRRRPAHVTGSGRWRSGHTSFDGTSFLAVLTGKKSQHRQFVYAVHNNYPEGPPYPIRSISDGALSIHSKSHARRDLHRKTPDGE